MTPCPASARKSHSPIRGDVDGVMETDTAGAAGRAASGAGARAGGGIGVGVAVAEGDGLGRARVRVAVADGDGREDAVGVTGAARGAGEGVRVGEGFGAASLGALVAVGIEVGREDVGAGLAGTGEEMTGRAFFGVGVGVAADRGASAVGVASRATTTFGPQDRKERRRTAAQRARDHCGVGVTGVLLRRASYPPSLPPPKGGAFPPEHSRASGFSRRATAR